MNGCTVPFEIDDSLKERRDPLTAGTILVASRKDGSCLVAPDEMVEGSTSKQTGNKAAKRKFPIW
jgi:hypothetical protein